MNAKEIWMGANDLDNENDWVWSDKSKFSFTSWRDKSEPNNRDNNEHCGTFSSWLSYFINNTSTLHFKTKQKYQDGRLKYHAYSSAILNLTGELHSIYHSS
jgi:hypothetical protein